MNRKLLVLFPLILIELLSISCSAGYGDFTVVFPYGYKYTRITSDYHVVTEKNAVSGADVVCVSADVSQIGYHHPFIVGKVTKPSSLLGSSNAEFGYFVLNVENGVKVSELEESALIKKLDELEIDEIKMFSPREFASEENPSIVSGLLRIE